MSTFPPPPPPPPGPPIMKKVANVFPPPPPPITAANSRTPSGIKMEDVKLSVKDLHPSHAFLQTMLPLSDALLKGMNGVEANHPLAELLFETCMTLRETLNLYAASSPTLVQQTTTSTTDATSNNNSSNVNSSVVNNTSLVPLSSSPVPATTTALIPQPRLHDIGLESLFTRSQKIQTMLQQRMWIDRSAMSHRTNIDVALGSINSASIALMSAHSPVTVANNLSWSTYVVYKKGHELLALDNVTLSSLNISSNNHLCSSFSNASNVTSIIPPAFSSPFKLLMDLRWIIGIKEVNQANTSSHKESGCELLVRFIDSLPLGSQHFSAVATGTSTTPSPTADRFLHLRFTTDGERQKMKHILSIAAHRNAMQSQIARGTIQERIQLWKDLKLLPLNDLEPTVPTPLNSLAALESGFLFFPKWQEAFMTQAQTNSNGTLISSSNLSLAPVHAILPTLPYPVTATQWLMNSVPFVTTFPVIWPARESSILAKQKARVLEVVIWPHQLVQQGGGQGGMSLALYHGSNAALVPTMMQMSKANMIRIWKHAHEKAGGSSSSGGGSGVSNSGSNTAASSASDHCSYGRAPMTGCYSDHDEKECSIAFTPNELVDFKFNMETLELELTCYVTKNNSPAKDEGAYNGRNTRNSSVVATSPPPMVQHANSTNTISSAAAAAAAAAAVMSASSLDLLLHSKYLTRKFIFHSAPLLRKFVDILMWFQSSPLTKDLTNDKLRIESLDLKLRDWDASKKSATTTTTKSSAVVEEITSATPIVAPVIPATIGTAAAATVTSPPASSQPPTSHLATLFATMFANHPSSKHVFDLYQLTKDLPHTKEGTLERLQLLVRKLYACGSGSSHPAPSPTANSVPVPERTNGLGGMGDVRSLGCTCPARGAPPSRSPPIPPAPGTPTPPSPQQAATPVRPIPVATTPPAIGSNPCYLYFYQVFLKSGGFHDLWTLLIDSTPGVVASNKRWALRGIWCVCEYIKPLILSSGPIAPVVPATPLTTQPTANFSANMNPFSGSIRHHHTSSISMGSHGSSSIDFTHGTPGSGVTHAQILSYTSIKCRQKVLCVWDESSELGDLNRLFNGSFSSLITSLIEPFHRQVSNTNSNNEPPTSRPSSTSFSSAASAPLFNNNLILHESLIDILFEIAVGAIRLDMVYSTTTTIEPITAYITVPVVPKAGPASSPTNTSAAPVNAFSFSSSSGVVPPKRETRVQVLNKLLVNFPVLPLILHLLPYAPLSATLLTLENFTWLLNGGSGNIRELLWNLEMGNGNFGGNLFGLLNLANHFMEQTTVEGVGTVSAAKRQLINPASALQKGAWDIFLDISNPTDASLQAPTDPSLVFNLTITLFTTLHYHSMLIHLNGSNLFVLPPEASGSKDNVPSTPTSGTTSSVDGSPDSSPPTPSGSPPPVLSSPHSPSPSSATHVPSAPPMTPNFIPSPGSFTPISPLDSAERVRFKSSLLFRTMLSLKSLQGWNEATTSIFRVMIICLLNVVKAEARSFTNNFELGNTSANNFVLNQFLLLLYVIEEFIFFRPIFQVVSSPQAGTAAHDPNSLLIDDDDESPSSHTQIGLHFDFGDDFDWSESAIEALSPSGISGPLAAGTLTINDSRGNLGRALDVPVIDKILDVFQALKLVSPQIKSGVQINNTSTVIGEGSSDKYEKKILDFFGRECKLWLEYRAHLSAISKATMSQNYKVQVDQLADLLALIRGHQNDRLKNLTSLSNYSKKTSGFFGSAFGSGKNNAALKSAYGLKDLQNNGNGITLYPHLFGLINKVVARVKVDTQMQNQLLQSQKYAPSPSTSSSSNNTPGTSPSSSLGSSSSAGTSNSSAPSNSPLFSLKTRPSRASIVQSNRVQAATTDSADRSLTKAKRSFQSIRHAKDFCERERRRSSVSAIAANPASTANPLGSFSKDLNPKTHTTTIGGISQALHGPNINIVPRAGAGGHNASLIRGPTPTAASSSPPVGSAPPTSPISASLVNSSPPTPTRAFPPPPPLPTTTSAASPSSSPPPPPLPSPSAGGKAPPPPPPARVGPPPVPSGYATTVPSSPSSKSIPEETDTVSELPTTPHSHRPPSMGAFICTVCSAPLPASAFWERNGVPYCAQDYIRTFLSCMICNERIIFTEGAEETGLEKEVRKKKESEITAAGGNPSVNYQYLTLADEKIIHNKCLKCDTCQKSLAPVVTVDPSVPTTGPTSVPLGSVSLFEHSGKHYCEADYYAKFGHNCTHCGKLIASNQSIQLAPDEEEDADGNPIPLTAGSGVTSHYHVECFVCSTCHTDLRALEAKQDEEDEIAFEKGQAIDPAARPPVYQNDAAGHVYCWPHWLEASKSNPEMASRQRTSSTTLNTTPTNNIITPPPSTPPLRTSNGGGGLRPSLLPRKSLIGMIRDADSFETFRHVSVSSSSPSAPHSQASTPASYQSNSYLLTDGPQTNKYALHEIGEDLDEAELSTSYSRSRS